MSDGETRLLLDEEVQKKSKFHIEKKIKMETSQRNSNVKYNRLNDTPPPSKYQEPTTINRSVLKHLFHSKNQK